MLNPKKSYSLSNCYQKHPRIFWLIFIFTGYLLVFVQTYYAAPRGLIQIVYDLIMVDFVVLTGVVLLFYAKEITLLLLGIFYIFLTFFTFFTDYIPRPYGTFFFLLAIWLLVDWYNQKKYKTSILYELVSGNFHLALGVFMSTFMLGILTELVNLPFMIWEYNIPIPSLDILGIPALIAAFGWTPWTLAILSVFYHYNIKNQI